MRHYHRSVILSVLFLCLAGGSFSSRAMPVLQEIDSGVIQVPQDQKYHYSSRQKSVSVSSVVTLSITAEHPHKGHLPVLIYTDVPDTFYFDTSMLSSGTSISIVEKTVAPDNREAYQRLKIRFVIAGEKYELSILGEDGRLPDIVFAKDIPDSDPSSVINPARLLFNSKPLSRNLSQFSGSGDSESGVPPDQSDSNTTHANTPKPENNDLIIGAPVFLGMCFITGQVFWLIGSTESLEPDESSAANIRFILDSIVIGLHISSYIVGLGIPALQELILYSIYYLFKGKFLGWRWIPCLCLYCN